MRIKLELDQEVTERLVQVAVSQKRPVAWQAEVLLRTALGLPFPPPHTAIAPNSVRVREGRAS